LLLGSLAAVTAVDVAYESGRIAAIPILPNATAVEALLNLQMLTITVLVAFVASAAWYAGLLFVRQRELQRYSIAGAFVAMVPSTAYAAFLANATSWSLLAIVLYSTVYFAAFPWIVRGSRFMSAPSMRAVIPAGGLIWVALGFMVVGQQMLASALFVGSFIWGFVVGFVNSLRESRKRRDADEVSPG
jgi:hypothetical protein